MYVLGINGGLGHDASACLVKDGLIVAMAEEERFTRQKHAFHAIPLYSTVYCLNEAGIRLSEVDYMALGWIPFEDNSWPTMNTIHKDLIGHKFFRNEKKPKIIPIQHHMAHAACAFYSSGFDEAAILVIDGQGEEESTTLAYGKGSSIKPIKTFGVSQSLGIFYTALTKYLGFEIGEEGKVMGLAPFGQPIYEIPLVRLQTDGYLINFPEPTDEPAGRRFSTIHNYWLSWFEKEFGPSQNTKYYYSYLTSKMGQDVILESKHKDIAASGQKLLETVILHLVDLLAKETKCRNLVISGGVGLNCTTNGIVLQSGLVNRLYVFPASSDAGTSAGAALAVYHELTGKRIEDYVQDIASTGPEYSMETIGDMLKKHGINRFRQSGDVCREAAQMIADGKVIGWFQGRMEIGPRALGNRSIISSPFPRAMHEKVNSIKGRENWRPLAPSMLEEKAHLFLEDHRPAPFMLTSSQILEYQRESIPAVVHVDGSCRPQTVSQHNNPKYWRLIKDFEGQSNIPVVLNTSFNLKGEPIVCSPLDAIRAFYSSGLDALVLEDFIVTK